MGVPLNLNLLVVIGANLSSEVYGDFRFPDDEIKRKCNQTRGPGQLVSMSIPKNRTAPDSSMPEPDEGKQHDPGMVLVPRKLLEQSDLGRALLEKLRHPGGDDTEPAIVVDSEQPSKVVLVMSRDNVAALMVIGALSILGAVYLYKICTLRRCVCRVCQNKYRQYDQIGSGGYGAVYLVDRIADGARFVAKKIPVRDITEVDDYSKEAKELITLRHRHIVSYEEDFVHVEYGPWEAKTFFFIVMEYCTGGDLKEKIDMDFFNFTEDWVLNIFSQLIQAVQFLHSKNVIHRDLKSQNVLLGPDGVRLADFGLCRHTRTASIGAATLSHAGTDVYMAPEMLSSSRYGKPADMWSLGCVLFELCTGRFMWELDGILGAMVMTDSNIVQKLMQEDMVPVISCGTRSLLRRLLNIRPDVRPTAAACVRKKLFKRGASISREPFGVSMGETTCS